MSEAWAQAETSAQAAWLISAYSEKTCCFWVHGRALLADDRHHDLADASGTTPARAELTIDAVRAYVPNLGTRQANDAEPAPQRSAGSAGRDSVLARRSELRAVASTAAVRAEPVNQLAGLGHDRFAAQAPCAPEDHRGLSVDAR